MTGGELGAAAILIGLLLAAIHEQFGDHSPRRRDVEILRGSARRYAQAEEDEQ